MAIVPVFHTLPGNSLFMPVSLLPRTHLRVSLASGAPGLASVLTAINPSFSTRDVNGQQKAGLEGAQCH